MIRKQNLSWMAASAVILFGMASCGHKAESDKMAEDTAPEVELAVEQTVEVDTLTDGTDTALAVTETVEAVPVKELKEKGDAYTSTPSGLKYKVIKKGKGKSPKATDVVLVNYEGKLTDGKVFDSSYERGEPISFPLNRVIPGWTEGLQLMQEGAVYEFYIPYNLAYGERGAGPIPPKSDLIFKVELLEVK